MKKRYPAFLALALAAALTGCSGNAASEAPTTTTTTTAAATTAATETEPSESAPADDDLTVRVGSMKGPTSMGLVHMMDLAKQGETEYNYDFTMVTAPDELLGKMVNGDLDIALLPANVASVLYNKTEGGVAVININTLGVQYIVSSDDSITSIAGLKGKTLYLNGKGTTPDYVIRYLLSANGLTEADVTLEYKSEATEVAAVLKEQPDAIGLLPQPFATVALAQNDKLKLVLDLTKEWENIQGEGGSQLVTGVTVVRKEFLEEQGPVVTAFLAEHKASTAFTQEQPDKAAELIAAAGIIEKAPVAKKALPYCNIASISGDEMKAALSGYLQVLFDQEPKSVGGKLPADDFYYIQP